MAQLLKQYDAVFKQKALELVVARGNVRKGAQELGISPELICRRRSESKRYCTGIFPGNGRPEMTSHEAEFAKLKKEWADVRIERDILKKRPSPSSPRAIGKARVHDATQGQIPERFNGLERNKLGVEAFRQECHPRKDA
jgi:transposase